MAYEPLSELGKNRPFAVIARNPREVELILEIIVYGSIDKYIYTSVQAGHYADSPSGA
jgi:hypothetical protein